MTIGPIGPQEETIIESNTGKRPVIKVDPPQKVYEKEKKIIRTKQTIWYVWMIVEIILWLRFLLKLFGANPESAFSVIITTVSAPLVFLFNELFFPSVSITGNMVIEWSTVFAMMVYSLIAWFVSRYFKFKKPIDPKEAEEKSEQNIL